MHAGDRGLPELQLDLLAAAAERETGPFRKRAAELLAGKLDPAAMPEAVLDFARSDAAGLVPSARRTALESGALLATGRHGAALETISRFRASFPGQAGDVALAADAAVARIVLRDPLWLPEFRLVFSAVGDSVSWAAMTRALSALETALAEDDLDAGERPASPAARLTPRPAAEELSLARARELAGRREYGSAVQEFRRLAALRAGVPDLPRALAPRLDEASFVALAAALPRPAFSDLARSFLYGSPDEARAGMDGLARTAMEGTAGRETAYLRLYWAGRFDRADERWADAAARFGAAASLADDPEDLDASLWYRIDSAGKTSIRSAVRLLADALSRTDDPAWYADLLEPFSRQALLDRDGLSLAILEAAVSRTASADAARLAYLCARAARERIIRQADLDALGSVAGTGDAGPRSVAAYIDSRLVAARDQVQDPWYRLLAILRLDPAGLAAAYSPSAAPAVPSGSGSGPAPADADERVAYALGLLRFGLASRLQQELGAAIRLVPPEALREAAEAMQARGDLPGSIRAIAPLFRRDGYVPTARDRELFWPRPWPGLFAASAAETGLPLSLLYGLARSESLFQADAVSSAGAVGLVQLMPATAAEMAGRLKLESYELTEPEDNLRLGAGYLKRMLDALDGRVLPALFSYNAGLSRYRAWEKAAAGLPADLALETLAYAETRQYGRNVAGAALMYALAYGEEDPESFAEYLLGE